MTVVYLFVLHYQSVHAIRVSIVAEELRSSRWHPLQCTRMLKIGVLWQEDIWLSSVTRRGGLKSYGVVKY
jgi:hypothetical protein